MKKLLFVCPLLFVICASADTVTLANGDRLTGIVRKVDDQKLYFKPEYSDEIAIKWSAVAKVTSDKPLHIERADNTKLTASTLEVRDDNVIVDSATPVTISSKDLKIVRSDAEELAYEETLHPGWGHAWHGGGNLGLGLARGNSDTTNLSIGFNAERRTLNDKTTVYANSVYSTDGLLSTTTANAIRVGIRYDRDITKRVFGYGSADFEHDAVQFLTIRSILGAGLGFHAINTKNTSFDWMAGGAYTKENYSTGLKNNFASISVGETYSHTFNPATTFTEKAFVFPYLNSLGDYRATFDAGLATKISKLLTWQVSLSDRYVTNPLPGTKGNDLLLTTGLGVTFGKKE